MATIPEEPHTDLEQYLNRIATGEGEIPAEPHTNVEQYLNYIIENGVGGNELVTELPEEGKEGELYVLVDDAEHPTKAYGVYTYAGGEYVLVAQPVDQAVEKVTELPEEGREGVLYYLEKEDEADTYDLYRWINDEWIKVDSDIILYSQEGDNVDGAMTQAATTALKGKAKVLTTADYNYPTTGTKNAVALWLLEPGFYSWNGLDVKINSILNRNNDTASAVIGKRGVSGQEYSVIFYMAPSMNEANKNDYASIAVVRKSDGSNSGTLNLFSVINNLTTTAPNTPLSASQGKVLKDLVDGNLGKVRVLTSADYNYPVTGTQDKIALWRLDNGIYAWDSNLGAAVYYSTTKSMADAGAGLAIIGRGGYRIVAGTQMTPRVISGTNGSATVNEELVTDATLAKNAGAPTTATVGTVGKLYEDTTNGKLYQCTAADTVTPSYTWVEVGAGGGSGVTELTSADYDYPINNPNGVALWNKPAGIYVNDVGVKKYITNDVTSTACDVLVVGEPNSTSGVLSITRNWVGSSAAGCTWYSVRNTNGQRLAEKSLPSIVQTTGTSQTYIMSQDAVTSMVYASPSDKSGIQLGKNATASGAYSIALGSSGASTTEATAISSIAIGASGVTASGHSSIVIGPYAFAYQRGAVAIGRGASASAQGQFDIGAGSETTSGYNSSAYRLLTGLYDPQSAHDAATKGYVDTATASIPTELTNAQYEALWSSPNPVTVALASLTTGAGV